MQSNDDALITIYQRNAFYRGKFHFALGMLGLCVIGIITLSVMLVYLIKHPPHPLYFVANPVGQLIADPSVREPNMTTQEVSDWVVEAVQSAYSYSFINYRSDLQNAQKYFTDYGWRNYMRGLTASNNLKAVIERKYIGIARVVDTPKLIGEGTVGGAHAWKFHVPLLVTYWLPPYDDNPNSKFYNPLMLTVLVQRQNLLTSYKGLGILQMIAEIVSTPPPTQNINPAPG